MAIRITRSNLRLNPNHTKVIPRFFNTGDHRSRLLINKVIQMEDDAVAGMIHLILEEFSGRYHNIESVFVKHFHLVSHILAETEQATLSANKKFLIGAYFTMEYSIEAAALFNPSIVEDPDQSGAAAGEKKVIISLRATGESHISSIVFKQGVLDADGKLNIVPDGKFLSEGIVIEQQKDSRDAFKNILFGMLLPTGTLHSILEKLPERFSYREMENALKNALHPLQSVSEKKKIRYDILSLVNTSYQLHFSPETQISERVIFPVTRLEKNGMEDARFVKFEEDDGSCTYIGTYTAYDGSFILPHLISTADFCHFKVAPLHGAAAVNKNLALFPRKINGQYAMLSRIDGFNNYIMFSDDIYTWEEATLLQTPCYPWELVQIGNAGSPIETEKGWLVLTHGVGPMRKYCLGASLFDLDDPTKELGRLNEPILVPNEEERYGYVPNVVYSCGSIIHGENLVVPYAVSDYASSFFTVPVKDLLDELLAGH